MEKEKKRNGPTNAGTCTSVVWTHRGADRKALPRKNIIIITILRRKDRIQDLRLHGITPKPQHKIVERRRKYSAGSCTDDQIYNKELKFSIES